MEISALLPDDDPSWMSTGKWTNTFLKRMKFPPHTCTRRRFFTMIIVVNHATPLAAFLDTAIIDRHQRHAYSRTACSLRFRHFNRRQPPSRRLDERTRSPRLPRLPSRRHSTRLGVLLQKATGMQIVGEWKWRTVAAFCETEIVRLSLCQSIYPVRNSVQETSTRL